MSFLRLSRSLLAAALTLIGCGYDPSPKEHDLAVAGKADGIVPAPYVEGASGTALFPHLGIDALSRRTIQDVSELSELEDVQVAIAMAEVGLAYDNADAALTAGAYVVIEELRVNLDRFTHVIAVRPSEDREGARPESGAYFRAGTTEIVAIVDSQGMYTHYLTADGPIAQPSADCVASAAAALRALEAQRPEGLAGSERETNLAYADENGELIRIQAFSGDGFGGVTRAVYLVATERRDGACVVVGIQDQDRPVDMSRTEDETELTYTGYDCEQAARTVYAALRLGRTSSEEQPALWGHELLSIDGAAHYVRFYDLGENNPTLFSVAYEGTGSGCRVRGAVLESRAQRLIDD